jgi:hypothetical protein
MYEWTRDWLRLRREQAALRRGTLTDLYFDDEAYAFSRRHGAETVVVAFNRAAAPRELSFPAAYLDAGDGAALEPLLGAGAARATAASGTLKLVVPPRTAAAYKLVNRKS